LGPTSKSDSGINDLKDWAATGGTRQESRRMRNRKEPRTRASEASESKRTTHQARCFALKPSARLVVRSLSLASLALEAGEKFLRPERPAYISPGRSAFCAALGLAVGTETSPERAQERHHYQDLTPLQGFAVEIVLTQGYAKSTLRPGLICAGLSGLTNLLDPRCRARLHSIAITPDLARDPSPGGQLADAQVADEDVLETHAALAAGMQLERY